MASFSLSDLIPEPLIYVDDTFSGDGKRYEMRSTREFSPEDFAVYLRWQREAGVVSAQFHQLGGDKAKDVQKAEKVMQQLIHILDSLVLHLMPEFPRERLDAIPSWAKAKIIERWRQEQPKETAAAGESLAGKQPKTLRGKRSPASVDSTAVA
jgi:hypothetical protein